MLKQLLLNNINVKKLSRDSALAHVSVVWHVLHMRPSTDHMQLQNPSIDRHKIVPNNIYHIKKISKYTRKNLSWLSGWASPNIGEMFRSLPLYDILF